MTENLFSNQERENLFEIVDGIGRMVFGISFLGDVSLLD